MSKAWIDIGVVLLYFVAISIVGLKIAKKNSGSKEGYFVGGRNMGWPVIGMSLFATAISTTQFVGQAGLAYKIGIAAANPQLTGAFMLGFSAFFFIPLYIRCKVFTVPDILEKRYSGGVRTVYGLTILTLGIIGSPFAFYAGGLAVLEIFNLDPEYLWICCLVVGGLIAIYAVGGGFTAVVVTDFIQGSLLLVGGIIVVVAGLMALPSLDVLTEGAKSTHLDLILPASDPDMPWTAVFSGLMIASIFFATTNHAILQKALGAKDVYNARCGMLVAAGLKVLAVFIIVLPGVIASALYPDINPDSSFQVMVNRLLPVGVSGLVLAAMIAALMSSADSGVNALAGIVSLNLYPLVRPNASEKESVIVGKITAGILLGWSVIAAPYVQNFGLIFPITLKISAFLVTPIGVCYLIGRFSKRVNTQGALAVLIGGYTFGVYLVLGTEIDALNRWVPDIILNSNFYYVSTVLFFAYVALIFIVSWLTPPPDPARVDAFMLSGKIVQEENRPWYQSFYTWLAVVIALFFATYLIF